MHFTVQCMRSVYTIQVPYLSLYWPVVAAQKCQVTPSTKDHGQDVKYVMGLLPGFFSGPSVVSEEAIVPY